MSNPYYIILATCLLLQIAIAIGFRVYRCVKYPKIMVTDKLLLGVDIISILLVISTGFYEYNETYGNYVFYGVLFLLVCGMFLLHGLEHLIVFADSETYQYFLAADIKEFLNHDSVFSAQKYFSMLFFITVSFTGFAFVTYLQYYFFSILLSVTPFSSEVAFKLGSLSTLLWYHIVLIMIFNVNVPTWLLLSDFARCTFTVGAMCMMFLDVPHVGIVCLFTALKVIDHFHTIAGASLALSVMTKATSNSSNVIPDVSLKQVIKTPELSDAFLNYCKERHAEENYIFLRDCENATTLESKQEVRKQWFSTNSPRVNAYEKTLQENYNEVYTMLEYDHFKSWKQTKEFSDVYSRVVLQNTLYKSSSMLTELNTL